MPLWCNEINLLAMMSSCAVNFFRKNIFERLLRIRKLLVYPMPSSLYGLAEAPQQGSTCCQSTRCNSFRSRSAASLRRRTRVLRSGGSPGRGIPASTKALGSLSQLFSSQWSRLVSLVAGSWMKPSASTAHGWYLGT